MPRKSLTHKKSISTRALTLPNKIRQIAQRVRLWAERANKAIEPLEGPVDPDLCGMCAIASARLHRELTKAGIPAKLRLAFGHAFVEAGGRIIDVTATQFDPDLPDIYERPARLPPKEGWTDEFSHWRHPLEQRFTHWRDMRYAQQLLGWPQAQRPSTVEIESMPDYSYVPQVNIDKLNAWADKRDWDPEFNPNKPPEPEGGKHRGVTSKLPKLPSLPKKS